MPDLPLVPHIQQDNGNAGGKDVDAHACQYMLAFKAHGQSYQNQAHEDAGEGGKEKAHPGAACHIGAHHCEEASDEHDALQPHIDDPCPL